jgi:hypothetical protein
VDYNHDKVNEIARALSWMKAFRVDEGAKRARELSAEHFAPKRGG